MSYYIYYGYWTAGTKLTNDIRSLTQFLISVTWTNDFVSINLRPLGLTSCNSAYQQQQQQQHCLNIWSHSHHISTSANVKRRQLSSLFPIKSFYDVSRRYAHSRKHNADIHIHFLLRQITAIKEKKKKSIETFTMLCLCNVHDNNDFTAKGRKFHGDIYFVQMKRTGKMYAADFGAFCTRLIY